MLEKAVSIHLKKKKNIVKKIISKIKFTSCKNTNNGPIFKKKKLLKHKSKMNNLYTDEKRKFQCFFKTL